MANRVARQKFQDGGEDYGRLVNHTASPIGNDTKTRLAGAKVELPANSYHQVEWLTEGFCF